MAQQGSAEQPAIKKKYSTQTVFFVARILIPCLSECHHVQEKAWPRPADTGLATRNLLHAVAAQPKYNRLPGSERPTTLRRAQSWQSGEERFAAKPRAGLPVAMPKPLSSQPPRRSGSPLSPEPVSSGPVPAPHARLRPAGWFVLRRLVSRTDRCQ